MATNQDLAAIVNRIRSGDSTAFTDLYNATYKSVFYHAQTVLKSSEDVEDAVQEAYEQAYMNLDKLKSPEAVASWLNQTVTNISLNKVRGPRGKTMISLDDEELVWEPTAPDEETPSAVMDRKGTEEIIGGFIDALPDVQKTTIILYYYDEMSVQDIAKAMDCSTGTVKSRLNYARKTIEKAVREEEKRGIKLYSLTPALLAAAIRRKMESGILPSSSADIGLRLAQKHGHGGTGWGSTQSSSAPAAAGKGTGSAAQAGAKELAGDTAATAADSTSAVPAKQMAATVGKSTKTGLAARIGAAVLAVVAGIGLLYNVLAQIRDSRDDGEINQDEYGDSMIEFEQDDEIERDFADETPGSQAPAFAVGGIIDFGLYEQDNDLENGPEPIEWLVLDVKGDKAFLLSRFALDKTPNKTLYNWKDCETRKWLEETFLQEAFTEEEQEAILLTEIRNDKEASGGISSGENTEDRIYLLSRSEVNSYLDSRVCYATDYAFAQGVTSYTGACQWGLRSRGGSTVSYAAVVSQNGVVWNAIGIGLEGTSALRPCMWVNTKAEIFTED